MLDGLLTEQQWIRIIEPHYVTHAAHDALLHVPTQCVLVKLWVGDGLVAGNGEWWFEVRHPRPGWARLVRDGPDLVARVEAAVAQLVDAVNRAQ